MNSIFEMFMESWLPQVSLQSKWCPKGFMLTLQETQHIHDPWKIEFIAYIYNLLYISKL